MNDKIEAAGWVANLVGVLGGLASFGTAVAALLMAIWRNGYRAGREAERRKRDSQTLEELRGGQHAG